MGKKKSLSAKTAWVHIGALVQKDVNLPACLGPEYMKLALHLLMQMVLGHPWMQMNYWF